MKVLVVWSGWENPRRSWEWLTAKYIRLIGNKVYITSKEEDIPFKPDVIFATDKPELTKKYAKKFKCPYVCWLIAGYPEGSSKDFEGAIKDASLLLAVSEVTRQDFIRTFPHDVEDKLEVCYHGVDTDEADKVEIKVEDVFTFVGNPENERKRFRWFREIVNLSGAKHRIISPEMFDIYKTLLTTLGTYHIGVEEKRKWELIKSSYAVVCTSSWETFFIPAAEAAYVRTPLISYDLPVIREIWGNSVLYFQDVDEAIWHIWELLEYPKLRRRIGERTRKQFEKKRLSLWDCAKRLEKFFEKVLE